VKQSPRKVSWFPGVVALGLCAILAMGCAQPNRAPAVGSLKTQKTTVPPASVCYVECLASDPDGDRLTYAWSATGGTFSGSGPVVNWVAPDPAGSYVIMVAVSDGRGGEATSKLSLDVRGNNPPVISDLTASPQIIVRPAMTSNLTCTASDADGDVLTYLWSAARGTVSGQGPTVVWTSPAQCADYVVSVTVSDGKGGEASAKVTVTSKESG